MNTEEIQKFIQANKLTGDKYLKITFKKRDPIFGIFIESNDAGDLNSKNLWRIVTLTHFKEWKSSKNINLSRIFNGSDFAKLAVVKEMAAA